MNPDRGEREVGAGPPSPSGGAGPPDGRTAGGRDGRVRGAVVLLVTVLAVLVVAWWFVGRLTADGRRLAIRHAPEAAPAVESGTGRIRIVAWNIAHGRGDIARLGLGSWLGGSREDRITRLARIADVLRRLDADVVLLNEVDFDVGFAGGLNQAEVLARIGGYGTWVEQRNYDVQLLFARLEFGNAVLSRLPVRKARFVELPPFSALEARAVGAKAASVVRLGTERARISVVPVHLEFRSEGTRLDAVPVLAGLRSEEPAPVVLGGDFNTAPPGWPETARRTAVGELLELGWRSPRAGGPPDPDQRTYPAHDPGLALDWILAEPPLRVVEARPIRGAEALSDHLPVLAVVEVPARVSDPGDPPAAAFRPGRAGSSVPGS